MMKIRAAAVRELGQRISWQLTLGKVIEAGLRALGYMPEGDDAEDEG